VSLVLVWLLAATASHGSQIYTSGNNCLYVSRQKDSQILVYADGHLDEHGDFDPIAAFVTNPNPTGIATHKNLLFVGSYGRPASKKFPERIPPNIEIYDLTSVRRFSEGQRTSDVRKPKMIGDFSHLEEVQTCYPESLVYYQGYLYVSCGIAGKGILKLEVEKKFFKARFGVEDFPISWGLTTRDNLLFISSHCHEDDDAGEGISEYCDKSKHDAVKFCFFFPFHFQARIKLFPFYS